MARVEPHAVERVTVLGAGTIGASWAAYFLSRGLDVAVWDPDPDTEARVRARIDGAWPSFERLGMAAGADPARVAFHAGPGAACDGAQFVQESAPERLELKQRLFDAAEAALMSDAVIASSSSYFPPSEMQARMGCPERLALGHPFNPPHLIPLVEVLGGARTDPAVVDWLTEFYAAIDRHPIRLRKEVPGHLVNRLQAALWREAADLVAQGVATAADLDASLVHGPGLRWAVMGPVLTYHLGNPGGLAGSEAHFGPVVEHYARQEGTETRRDSRATALMMEGVEQQAAGRSFEELAAERDEKLTIILEALARHGR